MTANAITVKKAALSPEHAEIVRATLPAVGAAIGDITPNFYRRMFGAHPELLADTFNRGNQKQGAQQRALAASVATFATMLVDPDAPAPEELLARIGHKHVSVGIREDQYPIVHKHLFDAIEEVLTPEVFQGDVRAPWDEVYLEMQRVLVDFENGLYGERGVEAGDVFRAARIARREELGGDVLRLTVELADGTVPEFRPGQYISVRWTMADGARQLRQYSLIGAPGEPLTFAVRRVDAAADLPAGEVSTALWEQAKEGDGIEISLPAGDLVLDEDSDAPVVLVSAGIGATPMLGMLAHLARTGSARRVLVLHADRSEGHDVLRKDRDAAIAGLDDAEGRTWYEPELMDVADVDLPAGAEIYLCGGNGFLQAVRDQLAAKGVDRDHVHFELFGPNDWLLDR